MKGIISGFYPWGRYCYEGKNYHWILSLGKVLYCYEENYHLILFPGKVLIRREVSLDFILGEGIDMKGTPTLYSIVTRKILL